MDLAQPGDESTGDERRYRIYIQVDEGNSVEYDDLFLRTFLRLKRDDAWTYEYFKSRNPDMKVLWRSLDNVDFLPVKAPDSQQPSTANILISSPTEKTGSSGNVSGKAGIPSTSGLSANQSVVPSSVCQPLTSSWKSSRALPKASLVWKHYEKETSSTAKCKFCGSKIKHSGNTTNLMQHLRRKHELYLERKSTAQKRQNDSNSESVDDPPPIKKSKNLSSQKNVPSIANSFGKINSFRDGGETANVITLAILYLICVAKLSLSLVENEAFKVFMKIITPLYTVPSRKTITTKIKARYEVLKENFKAAIAQAHSYTLTCDNWTDVSNTSYLGVTIHFLTPGMTMKTGNVGVIPLDERHTSDYLHDTLKAVCKDFGVETDKITAVVSDSAANIKRAVRDLVGGDRHLPCFAHSFSHLVPDTLKTFASITDIIKSIKQIVSLTKRSVVASDELIRLQKNDGKNPLKFIMDVETRWNYTLTMIERFLELEEYVYPVMLKCKKILDMPSREEIEILKDLVLIMKPVETVIREISGSSYPTCSFIIPIIHGMVNAIVSCTPVTDLVKTFQESLLKRINEKFKDYEFHALLGPSTILDPRFKKIDFKDKNAASAAVQKIDKILKKNVQAKENRKDNLENINEGKRSSVWALHDSLVEKNGAIVEEINNIELHPELHQYLTQPVIPRDQDPFKYWESLKAGFPSLYGVALKYLSIISSSVPSERLFSLASNIKDDDRARLTGDNLNILLFMSSLSREEWGL